ncbi:hypothetical protein [Paraburkholderia youngii]|uniref:hypothetical protein n=1 Tax=Paraburkholderia youngii TaxID=2782701 RepID=UPI003D1F1DAF
MLKRNLATLAVAGTFATFAPATFAGGAAGGIVFDPTNYVQNLQTAYNTLKTEALEIEAGIQRAQQVEASIKNTYATVKNFNGMGSIAADINALQSQWATDTQIMSEVGGQEEFVSNVMSTYSALGTNGTFSDYVTGIANAAAAGQKNAQSILANYSNMTNVLQKSIATRQSIAQKNTGTLGTNDSIAVTNAALDNLSEINEATLQGIQTLVRQAAWQQSQQAGQQQAQGSAFSDYYNARQTDATKFTTNAPSVTGIMGY